VGLLAALSNGLAAGFQRATLEPRRAPSTATPRDRELGLLLLDDEDRIETASEAAAGWLDELRGEGGDLPVVVTGVAHHARAAARGNGDVVATARVRAASGRWALVHGSVLHEATRARTAVTIEVARAPELAALIVDAHGLTPRERRVTELVAQGLSTAAIGERLELSQFTVQDHLKAIFTKLDVSSRGELIATLFVDHYLVDGSLRDPREPAT
jgi:DNA-binding CsgD family transcriptional regulator